MRVLVLGPRSPVVDFLEAEGEDVVVTEEPLEPQDIERMRPDFIVSYGYKRILKPEILERFPGRAINLHISLLPWNRGLDPNFWSFFYGTPKGVTIHYLDEGIDTGDIIAQEPVHLGGDETLRTSYGILTRELEGLFRARWDDIRSGRCGRYPQEGEGSYHGLVHRPMLELLPEGWDTPVSVVAELGRTHRDEVPD
jgi:methionyl-tRNA formyltransferase